jgi:hypothetical protein
LIYLFPSQLGDRFGAVACLLLTLGVLSDWISTTIGLNAGLIEGNFLAASLMEAGLWMPTDLLMAVLCMLVPYAGNKLTKNGAAKALYMFPLIAGVVRIVVSLWNLSLLI